MKSAIIAAVALALIIPASGVAKEEGKKGGEALFKQHCAACHPDGKNIVNPKKTFSKKDMEANKVNGVDDIVKLMRTPGPGMVKFDDKTIPEKEARAIAEYVLKTFTK